MSFDHRAWRVSRLALQCGRCCVGLALASVACHSDQGMAPEGASSAAPSASSAVAGAVPLSSIRVDHGELDTKAPQAAPELAATVIAATVYKKPDVNSRRLGYIRLGGRVQRDREPVKGAGCKEPFYRVYPIGFVCMEEATIDLEDPLVRAAARRPALDRPLPYRYGFVRATAPQYLRIPTRKEQVASEFKLEEHLANFERERKDWQAVALGANDVPLDERGIARPGLKLPPGVLPATQWEEIELYGGRGSSKSPPFWLDGGRKIPNVSGFEVPDYAVFADRVRRKTGLSFVDAFETKQQGLRRDFAVTVDLRLVPTSKVKPDSGSPFHGIEIGPGMHLPFAFVVLRDAKQYHLLKGRDEVRAIGDVPRRVVIPLSGRARIKAKRRYYQTLKDKTVWLDARDLGIVAKPPQWPEVATKGEKWIDISLGQQTLVLYEGKRPTYATLVSTGRDGMQDPETTLSTPQGTFRLQSKHVAAAMDSDEQSNVAGGHRSRHVGWDAEARATAKRLLAAEEAGKPLSKEDARRLANIKKGRHPEYGVTRRRGSSTFELRDVPWIQYFAAGYALHGAYWHDVFGIPRSHGCVNLAPIDARLVFQWTDPPVPEGWHGVNIGEEMGEGTVVHIHE